MKNSKEKFKNKKKKVSSKTKKRKKFFKRTLQKKIKLKRIKAVNMMKKDNLVMIS